MESILKWLIASYFIGLVATSYIAARFSGFSDMVAGPEMTSTVLAFNRLGLVLLSTMLSFGWGGVGIVLHYLGGQPMLFFKLSVLLAAVLVLPLWRANIRDKSDKMILAALITIGMGLVLPILLSF